MIVKKGFDYIIFALTYSSYASSQVTMCAIIERWMDIYLPFGEMTITLLNFPAITGLSFSGKPIPMSNKAHSSAVVRNRWLKDLFGATAAMKFGCILLV